MSQSTLLQEDKRGLPFNDGVAALLLWLLVFALYYPAAHAGFVADFTGWLEQERYHSFLDNLNRTGYKVHSLYQLTQLVTWIYYKVVGANPWAWHLQFISLHTLNACLLGRFIGNLLRDYEVPNSRRTAFGGALLFSVSPYISEVVVWEPSFHFLQGVLLIAIVLLQTQQYIHTGHKRHAWIALCVFFLSTFSLEMFYLTPWLVLSLGFFYRRTSIITRKLVIPLLSVFVLRIIAFKLIYGDWVSRIGSGAVSSVGWDSFGKPAKYLFHLLFLGRFMDEHTRLHVYEICDKPVAVVLFYAVTLSLAAFFLLNFRKYKGRARVGGLLALWVLAGLLLLIPLWFGSSQLVVYDRYTYFTDAFFYSLLAVLASWITIKYAACALLTVYGLVNARFTLKANRYWGKSDRVIQSLLHNLPLPRTSQDAKTDKTVILLNVPQNMHGVPMIGAEQNSEFKLMHDLLIPVDTLGTTVYDAMAYNMETPEDGANVIVVNDSTLKVTLNQWGTWWWYEARGGHSYENEDYRLDLKDAGHWYELTLKKPASGYILLYQTGSTWKVVDMSRINEEQR